MLGWLEIEVLRQNEESVMVAPVVDLVRFRSTAKKIQTWTLAACMVGTTTTFTVSWIYFVGKIWFWWWFGTWLFLEMMAVVMAYEWSLHGLRCAGLIPYLRENFRDEYGWLPLMLGNQLHQALKITFDVVLWQFSVVGVAWLLHQPIGP